MFISILIHELGHAFAMRFYGQRSQIVLHGTGGLTIPEQIPWGGSYANIALSPFQEILISLAGPGVGFFFAILVLITTAITGGTIFLTSLFGVIPTLSISKWKRYHKHACDYSALGQYFLGIINLVPVYPLDGGNVARYLLLMNDPYDGINPFGCL
ncbi:MAG: M50 family metallopeptidase [Anaerolineales bacterium]